MSEGIPSSIHIPADISRLSSESVRRLYRQGQLSEVAKAGETNLAAGESYDPFWGVRVSESGDRFETSALRNKAIAKHLHKSPKDRALFVLKAPIRTAQAVLAVAYFITVGTVSGFVISIKRAIVEVVAKGIPRR